MSDNTYNKHLKKNKETLQKLKENEKVENKEDAECQSKLERIFKEVEEYFEKTSDNPNDFLWLIAFKKREGVKCQTKVRQSRN